MLRPSNYAPAVALVAAVLGCDASAADPDSPNAPGGKADGVAPTQCDAVSDPSALASHLQRLQFEGWHVANADAGVANFGCSGGSCFGPMSSAPSSWSNGTGQLKILHRLNFTSSFWIRSSADGRFVGTGEDPEGARVIDLQQGSTVDIIADFDPAFFPDNSGFMFLRDDGTTGLCNQSVLLQESVVDFSEAGCSVASGIDFYQYAARGLGGDYVVLNSDHANDEGTADTDPPAPFFEDSTLTFVPMVFDGTQFDSRDPIVVDSPFEGDSVLSPSGSLVVSRLADADADGLGYVVRKVDITPSGNTFDIDISEKLATVCMSGSKANVSFDERFFVTHHYENGTANVYLVDLKTQKQHQITDMPAGTKALFPHFVSSGWIYFLASEERANDFVEHIVASDAALVIAAGGA